MACCSTWPPRCCRPSRRPQAPGRPHRRDAGAAHLGLGADAPPACARHRARRRAGARRHDAGWPAGRGSSCRCACSRGCSGAASSKNCSGCTRPAGCSSSASTPAWPTQRSSRPGWRRCARRVGGLRQAAVRRAEGGAGLPVALHAPGGDLQQPAARDGRARACAFRWKDYRAKGRTRHKTMTLEPQEFMRRFLLHVLPGGFHRIRHYGLLANGSRRRPRSGSRGIAGRSQAAVRGRRSYAICRAAGTGLRLPPLRSGAARRADDPARRCHQGATSIVSASTTNIAVMSTGHVGTSAGDACVSMRPRPSPAQLELASTGIETGSRADVSATRPANRRDRCSMARLANRQSP
jgi:hypothetical protein